MVRSVEDMNSILVSLFRYKAWANVEMHDALANFNAEQRHDEFQAMLRILDHVNTVDRIFKDHIIGKREQPFKTTNSEKTPNLSELREIVSATDNWYLEFVSNVSNERLKQRVQFTFTDGGNGAMSCEEMLLHVVTHGGYHRGSVGQMLEVMSIDSPPDSLTKFLHRHEPERRLSA
jgi:uncharacterized damage-inducible protein DinB